MKSIFSALLSKFLQFSVMTSHLMDNTELNQPYFGRILLEKSFRDIVAKSSGIFTSSSDFSKIDLATLHYFQR